MTTSDRWTVTHYTASDGLARAQANPLNLRWGKFLGSPGYVTYGLPFIQSGPGVDVGITIPLHTRPYATDFTVQNSYMDGVMPVMGGFITEIAIEDWDNNRVLSIAGKSWEHYWERIIWPKDPNSTYRTTTAVDPINGTVFDYTGTIDYLIYNLAKESLNSPNSLVVSGLNNPGTGGGTYRYRIDPGDTQSIAEHMQNIFALGNESATPYLKMDPVYKYFETNLLPRYGIGTPVTYRFRAGGTWWSSLSPYAGGDNCELVGFRHGGIRGTRMLGIANGPVSKKAAFASLNTATYRRWDIVEEFTKSNAYANLTSLVNTSISDAQIPDVEIQIRYHDFDSFDPELNRAVFPGARVVLQSDLIYWGINDTFTVTAVECEVNDEGGATYTATLNQPASFS